MTRLDILLGIVGVMVFISHLLKRAKSPLKSSRKIYPEPHE